MPNYIRESNILLVTTQLSTKIGLTLIRVGFSVHLKGGGVDYAPRTFRAISSPFFIQINPNTISNESWHLYLPVESLNIILSCIVLPQGGAEVA